MANINKFFTPEKLSENIRETPEGFLLCCDVAIARSGDLLYMDGETDVQAGDGGLVILSRTIEELAKKEAIASFEGKPVVIGHPIADDGEPVFINPDNWGKFTVGITQNVRRGEGVLSDKIIADLLITDRAAIEAVLSKELREISQGYNCETIQISKGYGVQRQFRGNHVALVPSGRNGFECAIFDQEAKTQNRGVKMSFKQKFIRILGKTLDEMPELERDGDEPKKDDDRDIKMMLARINLRLDKLEKEEEGEYRFEDRRHRDKRHRDRRHRDEDGYENPYYCDEEEDDREEYDGRARRDERHERGDEDYRDRRHRDTDTPELMEDTFEREDEEGLPVQDRRHRDRRMKDRRHRDRRMKDRRHRDEDIDSEIHERMEVMEEAIMHILKKIREDSDEDTMMDEESEKGAGMSLVMDSATLAKAEILAPGIRSSKDIKRKALRHAYKTEEGRKAIKSVLGTKTIDSADTDLLFNATVEALKNQRRDQINTTKFSTTPVDVNRVMTPADINELNAKRWAQK